MDTSVHLMATCPYRCDSSRSSCPARLGSCRDGELGPGDVPGGQPALRGGRVLAAAQGHDRLPHRTRTGTPGQRDAHKTQYDTHSWLQAPTGLAIYESPDNMNPVSNILVLHAWEKYKTMGPWHSHAEGPTSKMLYSCLVSL